MNLIELILNLKFETRLELHTWENQKNSTQLDNYKALVKYFYLLVIKIMWAQLDSRA